MRKTILEAKHRNKKENPVEIPWVVQHPCSNKQKKI